jgi:hypothetical protein
MRFARFHIAVVAVLAHAFALGQQLTNTSLDALAYENGGIRNNVDTNECFGFSLAIPAGWQLKPVVRGWKSCACRQKCAYPYGSRSAP